MIKRTLDDIIKDKLFKGKAIVIMGPRQVGKTTLLKQYIFRSIPVQKSGGVVNA